MRFSFFSSVVYVRDDGVSSGFFPRYSLAPVQSLVDAHAARRTDNIVAADDNSVVVGFFFKFIYPFPSRRSMYRLKKMPFFFSFF